MSTVSSKDYQEHKEESPFVRDENEDDDGYDPWSDRTCDEQLFEPDPWN